MNLFLYIDLNFSFNFGHYFNIFSNIKEICSETNTHLKLAHSEWKYYHDSESKQFEKYENFSRQIISDSENFARELIENVDFSIYDKVTVYIYKGGVEFIKPLSELHDHMKAVEVEFQIWNTLFLIPFDDLKLADNTFTRRFENKIKQAKQLLDNRDIQLCFDVDQSIWNKYFDKVHFLAPPLLQDADILHKSYKSSEDIITLTLDVWNLQHAPKYRNEEIGLLKKFVDEITSIYDNLKVRIKIADSAYQINPDKDAFFINNPQVQLVHFLSQDEYHRFIKTTDIYLLQYAPTFYKNKSSGHFLELLKNNVFTIGTKGTFLERYSQRAEHNYEFGNLNSLLEVFHKVMKDRVWENDSALNESHKNLIKSWSKEHFKDTLIPKSNVQKAKTKMTAKRTHKPFVILGNGPSLKGFDFFQLEGYDTIGMNAAYRYWDRINWYPTYYICLDTIVVKSHHEEINRLVMQSDKLGIKKFFVRKELFELQPHLEFHPKVISYEDMKSKNPLAFDCIHVTTGSFAARFGIHEGYKDLIMLGIDETYVNFIKESKRKENITLEITETPTENPNYFFADYQQKGDEYQIANHSKVYNCHCRHCKGAVRNGETLHVDAWSFIKQDIENPQFIRKYGQIRIINGNPKSAVGFFPFAEFNEAIDILNTRPETTHSDQVDAYHTDFNNISFDNIILPMISFFGKTYLLESNSKYNALIGELDAFTVELCFKSYYNRKSFEEFGDTSPPMPFIIEPFVMFDLGNRYRLGYHNQSSYSTLCEFDNNFSWNTLRLDVHKGRKQIRVELNGEELLNNNFEDLNIQSPAVKLGCGFKQRYWKGEIAHLKLFNLGQDNALLSYDLDTVDENFSLHESGEVVSQASVSNTQKANAKVLHDFKLDPNVIYYSSKETCQDKWVISMLKGQKNGFFVDIGASDGKSSNNTLTLEKFYGWKGICIEGNEQSYNKLLVNRKDQICLNEIISNKREEIQWRANDEMATRSGIDLTLPPDNDKKSWRKGEVITRMSETLENIFKEHNCPKVIDFLTIDIEGGEVNAMKDFPFDVYEIKLISAEVGFKNKTAFRKIMQDNGFVEVANPFNSASYEHFFVNGKYKDAL